MRLRWSRVYPRAMKDMVEVVGTGVAAAAPDLVTVEFRLQCRAATVAEALSDLAERSEQVLTAAREFDPAPRALGTTGLGVHQHHDREGRPDGHVAFQSLTVRVAAPERAGALIASLGQAGGDALGVDALTLGITDPAPLLHQARATAFEDARAKAEHYAALAGRSLGATRSVRERTEPAHPRPLMARAASRQESSIPVSAGETEIQATVTVTWALD